MTADRGLAVGVISLGCPKNLVDTEVMLGLLRQAGFALATDPTRADILLVNTCCFIEDARAEAAEAIQGGSGLAAHARGRRRSSSRAAGPRATPVICASISPRSTP